MNLSKILIVAFMLICVSIIACKSPKTMERQMTNGHFLVHLNEGYSQFDLREMLGRNANKILPSSKSENIFLIHVLGSTEEIDFIISDLTDHKGTLSVVAANDQPDAPSNGTNKDMKKTTRLGDM